MDNQIYPDDGKKDSVSVIRSTVQLTSDILGDRVDIFFAVLVCLFFSAILVCFSLFYKKGIMLWPLILSGITFAVIGWAVGIILTPYNANERSTFSQISKVVYGFITGYLLSKVDRLIGKLVEVGSFDEVNTSVLIIIMFCCSGFFLSVCTTYVSRTYWHYSRKMKNTLQYYADNGTK